MRISVPIIRLLGSVGVLSLFSAGCFEQVEFLFKSAQEIEEERSLQDPFNRLSEEEQERVVRSFQASLHQVVTDRCATCHGANQTPLFAVADPAKGAQLLWRRINFDTPDRSIVLVRSMNGHCGQDACRTDGTLFAAAVEDWGRRHRDETREPDALPRIQFTAQPSAAVEGSTVVRIPVQTEGGPRGVQVDYRVIGGNATAGSDYVAASATGTLSFAPYQKEAFIEVQLLNDTTSEGTETISIELGDATRAEKTGLTLVTLNIQDDEAAVRADFVLASSTTTSESGTHSVEVRLNGSSNQLVSIPVAVSGSASSSDYTLQSNVVTFMPGQMSASIGITLNDDNTNELNETIGLQLGLTGGSNNYSLGSAVSHQVTIPDNDPTPIVNFASSTQSVSERIGTMNVALSLDRASSRAITVPFTVSGSASRPGDHSLASASATFTAGSTSASISFQVVEDQVIEQNETVIVTLGTPTNATLGQMAVHTLTISESIVGLPMASFQLSSQSAGETGSASVVVSLNAPSSSAVVVPYAVGGTAAAGSDYTALSGSLTIAANTPNGTISVPITTDQIDEDNETVILTLGASSTAQVGSPSVHTLTVTDDDAPPTIRFASVNPSALENAGTQNLTISLSAASSRAVSATIGVSGTATVGADFTAFSTSVSIPAGSTQTTVSIPIVNDVLNEDSETIVLALGNPQNATLGSPAQSTFTITDNDVPPSVNFSIATQNVNENGGTATATVSLSAASGRAISVPYSLTGTARSGAGADFTHTVSALSFPAGTTSRQISISLLDDQAPEASDKTIILTLGSAPTNATRGSVYVHTMRLMDNDALTSPGQIAFRDTVYAITRRDCLGCHGVDQNPMHATDNITVAYNAARTVANFQTPHTSTLVSQIMNGHCGLSVCMTDGSAMRTAIADWARAEGITPTDPPQGGDGLDSHPFACTQGSDPGAQVVLRLTRNQYLNTLKALLTRVYGASPVNSFFSTAQTVELVNRVPADGLGGKHVTYDTEDQRISGFLIEAQYYLALAIANWVTGDNTRLTNFVRHFGGSACSTYSAGSAPSTSCRDSFIGGPRGFGFYVLRRSFDNTNDNDFQTYLNIYNTAQVGGFKGVIVGFLLSPGFLFQTEFKGTINSAGDRTQLTNYELASRLSYYLTDSMPDDALFTAAEASFSGTGNTLTEQVTRLLAAPAARSKFSGFFRQWMKLERIPTFNPSISLILGVTGQGYPGNGGLPANTNLTALRTNGFQEMVDLADYYSFGVSNGKLADILTSNISFAKTADIAAIYGVPIWNGSQSSLVRFPDNQPRAGLFTRAGFLFAGYPDANSIIRGARIRTEFLCDELEVPADTTPPANAPIPDPPSNRNVVTSKTQVPGTACNGCHTTRINPLGFPLEHYDALGRYRTEEPFFDRDDVLTQWFDIDAHTRPQIDAGAPEEVENGVEFSALLANSGKLHSCFTKHFFRYAMARPENEAADGCFLESMRRGLTDQTNGGIQNLIRTIPTAPEFRQRKFAR